MLATFNWANPVAGSFSDASKWLGPNGIHAVPGQGDDVVTPAGQYTITSSQSAAVDSFKGGAALVVSGGTFTVSNAASGSSSSLASLTLTPFAQFISSGGTTTLSGGAISGQFFAGGTINLSNVAFDAGNFIGAGGTYYVLSNVSINTTTVFPDALHIASGTGVGLTGSSSLVVDASMYWDSGTIALPEVDIAHGAALHIDGSSVTLSGGNLVNDGIATWNGAGDINLAVNSTFFNQPDGEFDILNDRSIGGGSAGGTLINHGYLVKGNASGADVGTTTVTVAFNNQPLAGNPSIPNQGTISIASGSLSTAFLQSSGTISAIHPRSSTAPFALHVAGNFSQTAAGILQLAVDGSKTTAQYAPMVVDGQASLAGKLDLGQSGLASSDPFTPVDGQVIAALTYGSVLGDFATFALPSPTNNGSYTPVRGATAYNIRAAVPPPSAPTGLALFPADDTGGPGVTAIRKPRLTGQAQPGLLVQVYDQNQHPVASAITNAAGTFTATVSSPFAPGSYVLKAVAIDSLNRFGVVGAPYSLTISPPPAAPTGLAILPADDTGGPGATSVTRPHLTGQAQAGLLVQIYDQRQHLVASAVAGPGGTFTATPTSALAPGTTTLTAVAIDAGGNFGASGVPLALTIIPAAPTGLALLPADDTGGPGVTAIRRPRLTGHAQAGLLVQVYDQNQRLVASAVADDTGSFVAIPSAPLAPGPYIFKAVAVDPRGRFGDVGAPFALVISPPPSAPTGLALLPADDTGGPGTTSVVKPRLTGRSQAGLLIQIFDASSTSPVASAIVAADGSFIATPTSAFSKGVHTLRAVAIDAGGNYGAVGATFTLTIV